MRAKLVFRRILVWVSALVTSLAVLQTGTACWTWFYQPKVPKSLRG